MVPNLSPQNLAAIEIGKDFMLSHGYIKHDFDVHEWAAPEFLKSRPPGSCSRRSGSKVTMEKLDLAPRAARLVRLGAEPRPDPGQGGPRSRWHDKGRTHDEWAGAAGAAPAWLSGWAVTTREGE